MSRIPEFEVEFTQITPVGRTFVGVVEIPEFESCDASEMTGKEQTWISYILGNLNAFGYAKVKVLRKSEELGSTYGQHEPHIQLQEGMQVLVSHAQIIGDYETNGLLVLCNLSNVLAVLKS